MQSAGATLKMRSTVFALSFEGEKNIQIFKYSLIAKIAMWHTGREEAYDRQRTD